MRRLVALAAVSALFLVGCGGDSDDSDPLAGGGPAGQDDHAGHTDHAGNPTTTCEPAGTSLAITVNGTKFDKNCLAAPANQAFTISFDNKDQLAHNIAILESHSATEAMFKAEVARGPGVRTLNVGALRPGTYAFHCEVHPGQMSGTFIVK
jgi:plastocyanin